ncbi:MAG: SDR family NAD(P)-dependent oxidoreductase [Balneolaceae bacterium]
MKAFYQHKTILVTGAASGIGNHFCERVASLGPCRLILWDRNPDILKTFAAGLPGHAEVRWADVDVANAEAIRREAEQLLDDDWLPDLVVNCAGVVRDGYFHELDSASIGSTIAINTTGSMWVVHAFLPEMILRGSGHVVNIASASGYIGNPRMSVYAASKWAVIGWSESLRLEMKRLATGVNVTVVIPSYIQTGMFDGVKPPLLVPILTTEAIVTKMLRGIARGAFRIQAPFMVRFVPLLKAVLPTAAFDWLAGGVLGVYNSMDTFRGRIKK